MQRRIQPTTLYLCAIVSLLGALLPVAHALPSSGEPLATGIFDSPIPTPTASVEPPTNRTPTVVPTATPAPPPTATPPTPAPTAPPTVSAPVLQLTGEFEPGYIEGDGTADYVASFGNYSNRIVAGLVVTVALPLPLDVVNATEVGFELANRNGNASLWAWRVPAMTPGTVVTGSFTVRSPGAATGTTFTVPLSASLPEVSGVTSELTVVGATSDTVLAQPGRTIWLRTPDNRVEVRIPRNAITRTTVISYTAHEQLAGPQATQPFAFALSVCTESGEEVRNFAAGLDIAYQFSAGEAPRGRGLQLMLQYFSETTNTWVPIVSIVDNVRLKVKAKVAHFTVFGLTTSNGIPVVADIEATARSAKPALFSGGLSYEYPFKLPPGPLCANIM